MKEEGNDTERLSTEDIDSVSQVSSSRPPQHNNNNDLKETNAMDVEEGIDLCKSKTGPLRVNPEVQPSIPPSDNDKHTTKAIDCSHTELDNQQTLMSKSLQISREEVCTSADDGQTKHSSVSTGSDTLMERPDDAARGSRPFSPQSAPASPLMSNGSSVSPLTTCPEKKDEDNKDDAQPHKVNPIKLI